MPTHGQANEILSTCPGITDLLMLNTSSQSPNIGTLSSFHIPCGWESKRAIQVNAEVERCVQSMVVQSAEEVMNDLLSGLQLRAILCTYVSFMVYPVIRANSQRCPYEHLAARTRYRPSYRRIRRLCRPHRHWRISRLMGRIEYLARSDCAF